MSSGNPHVLVTGGAGYIGSHVVLALIDAGHDVVVIDDLSTGRRELLPADVPLVTGDIADQALVAKTVREFQCDSVMHFAGSIVVPESVNDPMKYYRNNTVASHALISCCVAEGVETFVFSSSAMVYGAPEIIPISETAPTEPTNPYGASKLMTEWMLRDASAAGVLRYVALRYFNVAGADPKGRCGQAGPGTTHLIRTACELVNGKRAEMSIFGTDYDTPDGTCIRDYIHVADLANAHVLALEYLRNNGESSVMNCGYGNGFSVRQVLDVVSAVAGHDLAINETSRRDGDVPVLIAESGLIREKLGWTPMHDGLENIVRTALDWERKDKPWQNP